VVLRFVVEPSGLMTNIGVKNYVGGGCEEEAIRVLQLIKWYPAKKNDQLVRVEMTYPFYFILNDEFKDNSLGEQK
jgi:protein TonB